MSSILQAHVNLARLLGRLEITEPKPIRMKKAWLFVPPPRVVITDVPCAMVTYEQRPVTFASAMLHKPYSMHIQLFAGETMPDGDFQAEVAAAFNEALIQSLSKHQTLGGAVSLIQGLRGQTPETLTVLERAGKSYVGIDLFLDVLITEPASHAAEAIAA
jgi:hypothetical protein